MKEFTEDDITLTKKLTVPKTLLNREIQEDNIEQKTGNSFFSAFEEVIPTYSPISSKNSQEFELMTPDRDYNCIEFSEIMESQITPINFVKNPTKLENSPFSTPEFSPFQQLNHFEDGVKDDNDGREQSFNFESTFDNSNLENPYNSPPQKRIPTRRSLFTDEEESKEDKQKSNLKEKERKKKEKREEPFQSKIFEMSPYENKLKRTMSATMERKNLRNAFYSLPLDTETSKEEDEFEFYLQRKQNNSLLNPNKTSTIESNNKRIANLSLKNKDNNNNNNINNRGSYNNNNRAVDNKFPRIISTRKSNPLIFGGSSSQQQLNNSYSRTTLFNTTQNSNNNSSFNSSNTSINSNNKQQKNPFNLSPRNSSEFKSNSNPSDLDSFNESYESNHSKRNSSDFFSNSRNRMNEDSFANRSRSNSIKSYTPKSFFANKNFASPNMTPISFDKKNNNQLFDQKENLDNNSFAGGNARNSFLNAINNSLGESKTPTIIFCQNCYLPGN